MLGGASVLLFLGAVLMPHAAGEKVTITAFGIEPDSGADAVPAMKRALARCAGVKNPVLVFPKGRYDFYAEHSARRKYYESNTTDENPKVCPILLDGMSNLTIDGSGSNFIFHGQMQPFTVDRCTGVTIRNVNIDWDVTLTAQGEVVKVKDDYFDLLIDEKESPYVVEDEKLVFVTEDRKSAWWGVMEFERNTRLIPQYTGDRTIGGVHRYRAERRRGGRVRLHGTSRTMPKKGNFLVLRHNPRIHAGIFLFHSQDVVVENVNVYHTGGLGILAQFCENLRLNNTNVVPNPEKGRYLSGHDDGAHISNCRGLVCIENCSYAGLMDDPINVHGTSVRIAERLSDTRLRCRFMHHQTVGLAWARPGEKVGFIENDSMRTVGEGTITSFTALNTEEFEVAFAGPVPDDIEGGDALENLTWAPDVTIRDCTFGSCRARGVLISTPGTVRVEDNVFQSSGSAILIAGDANQWYESGAVRDVLIRGNTFEAPCLTNLYQFCEAIISICPEIPKPEDAPRPFHRNIRIENNTFHPFDYPVLYALSVEGLTFKDNTLIRSTQYEPYHHNKHLITLDACRDVVITGTVFKGDVLGRDVHLKRMDAADARVDSGQGLVIK